MTLPSAFFFISYYVHSFYLQGRLCKERSPCRRHFRHGHLDWRPGCRNRTIPCVTSNQQRGLGASLCSGGESKWRPGGEYFIVIRQPLSEFLLIFVTSSKKTSKQKLLQYLGLLSALPRGGDVRVKIHWVLMYLIKYVSILLVVLCIIFISTVSRALLPRASFLGIFKCISRYEKFSASKLYIIFVFLFIITLHQMEQAEKSK